jgi:hypothetical protein
VGSINTKGVLARWFGDQLHGGTGGPGFDPRVQRVYLFCNTWSWDPPGLVAGPVVRAGRVGPASQVGWSRGTRQSGRPGAWDPLVRSARRVGPASQVAWDPRVRSDRYVGPVCQVGLTKFKCMTDGSYIPRKINGPYTPHKKN